MRKARLRPSVLVILGLAAAACGRERSDPQPEDLVTIAHGLYGQAISVNDVGDPNEQYLAGFAIDAFAAPTAGGALGAPQASTSTDARGFYQLELPAGAYVVCTSFGRCVLISLADGELVRLDYEFGVGPGWSLGTPWIPG